MSDIGMPQSDIPQGPVTPVVSMLTESGDYASALEYCRTGSDFQFLATELVQGTNNSSRRFVNR